MISALLELLSRFYQAGDVRQMEAITRSILRSIPDDLVALQFLALALHQRGQIKDAYSFLRKVAERQAHPRRTRYISTGEPAAEACYREATRFGSRLAEGWFQISHLMTHYGFKGPAARALRSARAATTDRRRVLRRET